MKSDSSLASYAAYAMTWIMGTETVEKFNCGSPLHLQQMLD